MKKRLIATDRDDLVNNNGNLTGHMVTVIRARQHMWDEVFYLVSRKTASRLGDGPLFVMQPQGHISRVKLETEPAI